MFIAIAFAAVWLTLGVLAAGWTFAFFQRKYQHYSNEDWFYEDRRFATAAMFLGPFALLATLIVCGTRYGWLWPYSAKAKEEAGLE